MLIYILPFVLLLAVALILKKKEASQQDSEKKKPQALKVNKKTKPAKGKSSSTSHTAQASAAAIEQAAEPVQANLEFRKRIEALIQEQNFSTAEALINQELNRDKDQHELYLLLADIHLIQDDNFGLVQLLSHLRALNLFDLVRQIEAKLQAEKNKRDTIQYTPVQLNNRGTRPEPTVAAQTIIEPVLVESKKEPNTAPAQIIETENAPQTGSSEPDVSTLNFNFQDFDQIKSEPQVDNLSQNDTPNLDFKLKLEPHSVETKGAPMNVTKTDIGNGLEFGLAQTPSDLDIEAPSIETKTEAVSAPTSTPPLMEFNLEPSTTEVHIEQQPVQETTAPAPLLEFKFDFTAPTTTEEPRLNEQTTVQSTPVEMPSFSFEFTPSDVPAAHSIVEPEIAVVTPSAEPVAFVFDEEPKTKVTQPSTSSTIADPILQQFSQLGQIKETQLDLDLAQQYIKLGAYEAARDLLATNTEKFDANESEQAKKLLNQIAS